VPLPDETTRRAIFEIQFRCTPVAAEVDLDQLAKLSEGLSGAEVVAVCREAALFAMREDMGCQLVTALHFDQALSAVKPRTSVSALKKYEEFEKTGGVLAP
jgi:AAA family ATPase